MAPAKLVAITGGARGIGRASAAALVAAGARVVIGDLDADAARAAASDVGAAAGAPLDVSDAASFERFLDSAEQHGALDVLVNNAGIMDVSPLADEDAAAIERMIAVNLLGTVHGTRLALRRMLTRGSGHIINVASAASYVTPANLSVYAASKHGVLGLTDAVRAELRGAGVAVTAVFPNVVATDLAAGTRPLRGDPIAPEDVGRAIAMAVRTRQAEVYVPRSLGPALRLPRALPVRARAALLRAIGVDRLYTGVDPSARAAYSRLIAGSGDER